MEVRLQLFPKSLKSLLRWIISVEVIFAIMYIVSKFPAMPTTIVELFDFDAEASLPAWFSASQLSGIGLTFLLWAFWQESRATISRGVLLLLGLCFVFFAADEAVMLHERVTPLLLPRASWIPRVSGDRNLWVPVYFFVASLVCVKFRRDFWQFWLAFPRQTKTCCLGAALILFGAVGLEVLNYHLALDQMASHWPNTIQILIEEFFEMLGASFILYGVISMAWSALADISQPSKSTGNRSVASANHHSL